MAGLPQWEYIVIILCGEVILAVGITLLICWRCRWAKQDKSSAQRDEKKPLPYVDELMDDMFTKDSDDVITGHPPSKHDYPNDVNAGPWILVTKSERDEIFSAKPKSVGFKNEAFTYFDHKDAVEVQTDLNDNENVTPVSRNENKIGLLAVANNEFKSHSRESSLTITPVDAAMNDLDTPTPQASITTSRPNTGIVVRSAAVANEHFEREAFRNQYNREMELMRSPPPKYTSSLEYDRTRKSGITGPLWESKLHN